MKTHVQRWGNSLALRIPKAFAVEAGLAPGTLVDLSIAEGKLIVTPLPDAPPTLDQLLADITDDNLHAEIGWGPTVGKESW